MMFSGADLVLLGIVAISTLVGVWRGFLVEMMSLVVWVLAFGLSFHSGPAVAGLFDTTVETPAARLLLGYALVFFGVLALGGLINWLLARFVRTTGLSGPDRLLGLMFGLVRGVVLGCLLVLLLGLTALPRDAWWRESSVLPGFQRGAEWMRTRLPATVAEHIRFTADDSFNLAPSAPPGE